MWIEGIPTYRHLILFKLYPICSSFPDPSHLFVGTDHRRPGQPHGHCHRRTSRPPPDSLALDTGQSGSYFWSGRTSRRTTCRTVLLPRTFVTNNWTYTRHVAGTIRPDKSMYAGSLAVVCGDMSGICPAIGNKRAREQDYSASCPATSPA
jgi:hypothetical protein